MGQTTDEGLATEAGTIYRDVSVAFGKIGFVLGNSRFSIITA